MKQKTITLTKKKLEELYNQHTINELCQILGGIHHHKLYALLEKHGIKKRGKKTKVNLIII